MFNRMSELPIKYAQHTLSLQQQGLFNMWEKYYGCLCFAGQKIGIILMSSFFLMHIWNGSNYNTVNTLPIKTFNIDSYIWAFYNKSSPRL